MVIVFAFVLITLSTFMYARVIVNLTTRLYSERTQNLAGTAAEFVDAEAAAALRVEVEAIYDTVEPKVFSDRYPHQLDSLYMERARSSFRSGRRCASYRT